MPREIAEEEEATAVSLNMRYHRGYIPEISGSSNLGIWKGTNEETGEEETGFNNIDVNYYDVIEGSDNTADHIFEPEAQVVDYKSAAGWSSHVWYNSPETEGERIEYRIDAQGCLYREVDRRFRVNRYQSQAEYDAYQENGQWGSEDIGEAATIAGALQALAYDSELNADSAYYTLGLIQDWDNKSNDKWFWETELGNLSIPETVKGLRLTAEGQDTENGFRKITGTLSSATINAGTELELAGWYRAKEENILISGGGYKYKITNAATNGKGTVSVTGLLKKTAKKISIADTVTIGGIKFKIVSIEKNAFKGCKKATDISIGKNVTSVGDYAFSGCTSLKKVTVGKAVKTIGKSAFEKDSKLKSIKIQSAV